MTKKRVLIVDDSKSARFVLKRMLNELQLEVDTAGSALDAIKYLEYYQPDIIFMDHMMPGMDGFEAVKQIKDNPLTAVIPIMMYTSKGGDVYLSQARALGAVGIIRKTIAPVELRESLLELGLIEDVPVQSSVKIDGQEIDEQNLDILFHDSDKDETKLVPATSENKTIELYIRDLHRLMDDQTIELHRSMWLGIESVGNEIFNRLNLELEEKIEKLQSELHKSNASRKPFYASIGFWSFFIVCILLLIFLGNNFNRMPTGYITNNSSNNISDNSNTEIDLSPELITQQAPHANRAQTPHTPSNDNKIARELFNKWTSDITLLYPYDEVALNSVRQPFIEELINKAKQVEYKGQILLQTHAGEFCLSSDHTGGYILADKNTKMNDCDIIGNTKQLDDEPTSHQSLSFVNYFSDNEALKQQGIFVEVKSLSRKTSLSDYPEISAETTAALWNQAAKLNNRITVKLIPDTSN